MLITVNGDKGNIFVNKGWKEDKFKYLLQSYKKKERSEIFKEIF